MSLSHFHPIVARWFSETLGEPTPAQRQGWAAIRDGRHTLIAAPTGSGKTLAAFLSALDDLFQEGLRGPLPDEVRLVYVSPLKALSADIHKNLAEPRRGIRQLAEEMGLPAPRITAAVRTGDTPQSERAAMVRTPPHILVTTPESLYLLLTAERSREMLRTVRTIIVDEIHAVIGTRRGAHLALSLERLQQVADAPLVRLGLSATQKPIDEVARFLVGTAAVDRDGRAGCAIVDEGHQRERDLGIELPRSTLDAVMSHEIWEEYYERLTALIAAHRTTLIFVNTRRMAERVTRHLSDRLGEETVTAHHGSLSKEKRLDAETRLKAGQLKALVATASLELGIDIGSVDLVCQIGSPHRIATLLQRVGRSGHSVSGTPKGRLFPISRDDFIECAALLRSVRRGELDRIVSHDAPLDVLAQQLIAESACEDYGEADLFALSTRAWPYRALTRPAFDAVLTMVAEGFSTRRGRRAALVHRDEVQARVRGRRGTRLLALTSGGAIPEIADYRVLLEPEDTFIGTLNEDFAIESTAGDVFQLGNASWRVLQVTGGVVRVADAKGAPPTLPFWLGEAPARSDELSHAVSALRADVDRAETDAAAIAWLVAETGLSHDAAQQAIEYLLEGRRALGALPTQDTIILERFFDESGGMQLVLHAPFGSRINKAWGLALRKRFCRQFNFELQAAATEDAVLLSLGPQHSFPLADVLRYLHPASARDLLVQAFLDAPVFQTRWRWNTTISLAVPRNRGGRKVAPQIQRMMADDLMAAVFPDAAACLENIPGDRQIPDHPLVEQTVRDCLQEAMDFDGLAAVLTRIHGGDIRCLSRDTPEPSVLAHEILNARPYAFLDDAPLEERRTQAVYARRAGEPAGREDLGALDPAAIARVREEIALDPRDADELHDALLTVGVLTPGEVAGFDGDFLKRLTTTRRATLVTLHHAVLDVPAVPAAGAKSGSRDGRSELWVSAERLPELLALHAGADATMTPAVAVPSSRATRTWTREEAIVELLRGAATISGPTTAREMAARLVIDEAEALAGLHALEAEGAMLRGAFTPVAVAVAGASASAARERERDGEWCDRRLLARIHRYTLNRLRAEIEAVSPADFMRFLFVWQHVDPVSQLSGPDGLRDIIGRLDGFELPANAWERAILPARMDRYEPSMLDMLCLTGDVGWARLAVPSLPDVNAPDSDAMAGAAQGGSAFAGDEHTAVGQGDGVRVHDAIGGPSPLARLTGSTPVALFLRDQGAAWQVLRRAGDRDPARAERLLGETARRLLEVLRARGASFSRELAFAVPCEPAVLHRALGELVSGGLVSSDGFAGLRAIVRAPREGSAGSGSSSRVDLAGRWSELRSGTGSADDMDAAVTRQAWALLRRYGVVCRHLLREANAVSWRDLSRVYRRLEARGEIRGGRFVAGMSGEQFALADAVERLREVRRTPADDRLQVISAADPLNLTGVVGAGDRVRALGSSRIVYRHGVALAAMEGDYLRPLAEVPSAMAAEVASALAGRRVPAVVRGFVGRTG
jgi:ATP-dependent Lhr-like helicase